MQRKCKCEKYSEISYVYEVEGYSRRDDEVLLKWGGVDLEVDSDICLPNIGTDAV